VQQLRKECAGKLASISQTPQYTGLLKQLIIQGLIKIEEPVVQISCRSEDKALVRGVVSPLVRSLPRCH
jgi:vacuolar-type H+-ATPase subunit E/Vma4